MSALRTKLKRIVEETDTPAGKGFDLLVQTLIFVSVISFMIETMPSISSGFAHVLFAIEIVCVIFFTLEYFLRIYVSDKPLRFVFSVFGIFDLLAILPFYITTGLDFRSLRAFRFLRLFQIFKLSRYSKAMRRLTAALRLVKEEFALFGIVTVILIYFSAIGIYYLEREAQPEVFSSVFNSLWWAVSTLSTVGYGDIYPITAGGKLFTYFILLIGLAIVAIPAGLISSALAQIRTEELNAARIEKERMYQEIRTGLRRNTEEELPEA